MQSINHAHISEYLRLDGYNRYLIEDRVRASNLKGGILYGMGADHCNYQVMTNHRDLLKVRSVSR